MSHEDLNEAAPPASRRDTMKLGGLVALAGLARMTMFPEAAMAQTQPKHQSLKPELWNKTPWKPAKRGDFDLAKYTDNHLATMKITNNLVGERTYIPMITRALLGPQGKGAAAFYGHVGMWIWQLQEVDPAEFPKAAPGSLVQRAMYTGMILDPRTYEPVETVYNHVLDRQVKVEDSLSAETYVFNMGGGGESIDRAEFMTDKETANRRLRPMARFGDDICLFLDGIFSSEGPHQPRMDTSIWTMDHADLMMADRQLRPVDYNFAGLMRAWERGWTGFSKPDETQILWNVKGTKVHSLDDMPDIIQRTLLAKYPDRV
jgi:hypothetical protein